MKIIVLGFGLFLLMGSVSHAEDRHIDMSINPVELSLEDTVTFQCNAEGEWKLPLRRAQIVITDGDSSNVISRTNMDIDDSTASYTFIFPDDAEAGTWKF